MLRYRYLFIVFSIVFLYGSMNGSEKVSLYSSSANLFKKAPGPFKIIQDGFIYVSYHLPFMSTTSDGTMKMGYGAGFDGTVFLSGGWGVVTNFGFSYQQASLDFSSGSSFLYWFMPGVKFAYEIENSYKKKMFWECEGLIGVNIFKPVGALSEIGSSGSIALGAETGFTLNQFRVAVRYFWSRQKFEYTIFPYDFVSIMRISYFQFCLGYVINFNPRYKPK